MPDAVAVDTAARLTDKEAAEIALKQAGLADGVVTESSLAVINPGIISDEKTGAYLAYRIHVDSASQGQLAQWVFVDAQTGDVRFSYASHPESRDRNTYNCNALNQSCNELYGVGSADCVNVKAALDAVEMWGPICGVGGATATPTHTPTTVPTATATPTDTPTTVPTATATPTRTPAPPRVPPPRS